MSDSPVQTRSATPDQIGSKVAELQASHEARLTMSIHRALSIRKDAEMPKPPALTDLHMTDLGNAQAMAQLFGHLLRYDHRRARWLMWNENRWIEDHDGYVERIAQATCVQRARAACDLTDTEARQKQQRFAVASESRRSLSAMISLGQSLFPMTISGQELDQNDMLLGCENGVIDLSLMQTQRVLRPGYPDDLITMSTGLMYDELAECPRWEQFLDEVFSGDFDLIRFVKRAVGYCLTGSTKEQCLFLCWGSGCNGKSTFLNVLRRIFGDYARNTPFSTFEVSHYQGIPNDLAALSNVRLVTASETAESTRLNEARVKAITGGDPISCRFMRGEWFEYIPAFKVWLAMNHKPEIRGTDNAIWRRIRLIPFRECFEDHKDPDLERKLIQELPGILFWAVEGCCDWQIEGLGMPEAVRVATQEYRQESDVVRRFLDECTVASPLAKTATKALYGSYTKWCQENGEDSLSSIAFGKKMAEHGFERGKDRSARWYSGLAMLSEVEGNESREEPLPF